EAANYPFCTIEPNVGMVTVPDSRLEALSKIINPERVVHSTVEFVDIAGLVEGAAKGEGLGNKFLSNIRNTAALCQVVRCFEDENIIHVSGSVNPIRDIEIINGELILSDIETVEKALEKQSKLFKAKQKEAMQIVPVLEKCKVHLEEYKLLKTLQLTPDEFEQIRVYQLLTLKPMIFAANVSEDDLATGNEYVEKVREYAKDLGSEVVVVSARVESELQEMEDEDKKEFLESLGVDEPGLNRLIRAGFNLLGLQTYFTAGVKEVRSWTIRIGDTAPKAAGEIHTDFERGFIRAKVVSYEDFIKYSGWKGSQEAGSLRLEGKDYIVKDGDLMEFLFNV
ncbi:MAG: redox-regulated ATPase YchF, partial [Cetobacterium sp.]